MKVSVMGCISLAEVNELRGTIKKNGNTMFPDLLVAGTNRPK